jgi:hypothetical protein
MALPTLPATLELRLTLTLDDVPIGGIVHHRSTSEAFGGWLELIAAIDAVLQAAKRDRQR